jgi:hypothetical protein
MNNNSNNNRKMRRTRDSAVQSSTSLARAEQTNQTRNDTGGRGISLVGNNKHGDQVLVDVSKTLRRSTGSSVSGTPLSGYDWYFVRGDAGSAYSTFSSQSEESSNYATQYNRLLLAEMIPSTSGASRKSIETVMKELTELETLMIASKKQQSTTRFIESVMLDEYYFAYNTALMHYGLSNLPLCLQICAQKLIPLLQSYVSTKSTTEMDYDMVICHVAFLFLECVLAFGVGRNNGLNDLIVTKLKDYLDSNGISFCPTIEIIIEWLDELVKLECMEPQIKFLIPLYKSRISLAEFDPITKLRIENSTRAARKDMKTAMEIFHNKLRPSYVTNHNNTNETDSVASSTNSFDEFSTNQSQQKLHSVENEPSPPTTSTLATLPSGTPIQKLNQHALSVKAHLEQLKGNTKKSLILCSEALTATTGGYTMSSDTPIDDTSSSSVTSTCSWYDAIHANNLAVIYATNGRKHLALHAMAKALRANARHDTFNPDSSSFNDDTDDRHDNDHLAKLNFSNLFFDDGTVRHDVTLSLLYNAAMCGLRARNFISAYECMVTCMIVQPRTKNSSIFNHRTRCFLHLSEACIGIHSQILDKHSTADTHNNPLFSSIEVDGYVNCFFHFDYSFTFYISLTFDH